MPAAVTDKFNKVSNGSQALPTTLSANKAALAVTASLNAATGWDTTTAKQIRMYKTTVVNGQTVVDTTKLCYYQATLAGTTLSDITLIWSSTGSDQAFLIGDSVDLAPTTNWADDLMDGILVEHKQTGAHSAVTADSVASAGLTTTLDLTVTNAPTFTIGGALFKSSIHYTYDGTDIFVDGVDQNNAANTISWTKPTGLKFVVVEVQAPGGGSGGTASTTGTQAASSGGGGGGGYSRKKILAASLGATETVTVGAVGTAGAAGNNNGGAGGSTSFGTHATATGGSGGAGSGASAANSVINAGAGGTGSSGNINIPGSNGGIGYIVAADAGIGNYVPANQGGASYFASPKPAAGAAGTVGNVYGGGASGSNSTPSSATKAGAVGGAGIVIVHEYF